MRENNFIYLSDGLIIYEIIKCKMWMIIILCFVYYYWSLRESELWWCRYLKL